MKKDNRKRKYTLNEEFFENPELWGQKQAYFLGWLLSDGHHNIKNGSFSIKLQERDKKILEILKDIIQYTGNLYFIKRGIINNFIKHTTNNYQNRYGLSIVRREVSNSLIKLDIKNNKTDKLEFPKYLKPELISHFLRGYYDGDGTISYHYNKNNLRFDIHLLGTINFCGKVKELLIDKFNIKFRQINKSQNKTTVQIQFSGRLNALKFFNFVYKDAKYVLKRKFKKFLRLINYTKKNEFTKNKEEFEIELNKAIIIAKNIIKNAKY